MSFRPDFFEDITTMDTNKGAQVKLDFYFKSGSSLTQTPEAGRTKLDAQIASELHLGKKCLQPGYKLMSLQSLTRFRNKPTL
jgi:hypothetical protein